MPLSVLRDGRHHGDVDLVLSAVEAEQFHAAVARALDDGVILREITRRAAAWQHERLPVTLPGEA
ncbi:hypothetical protein IHE55_11670 [Streptomyces pactum]|uniref:Uncharacterized protein n=1 Tax=Streptomyces pactum TaxID=68249 RepID=A0ABS0NJQ8_9ACTN|nr:hypothetical protein [Streptomyces pactum]MBH5335421.1 hypothetical protein [Streptomyces pactum]